ncbi:MAG: hypothetical protein VKK97_11140 [Synechococcaceae cyanobacterium]|nr:hypothetical protein [Synechococcaceae cyanobacterium]
MQLMVAAGRSGGGVAPLRLKPTLSMNSLAPAKLDLNAIETPVPTTSKSLITAVSHGGGSLAAGLMSGEAPLMT